MDANSKEKVEEMSHLDTLEGEFQRIGKILKSKKRRFSSPEKQGMKQAAWSMKQLQGVYIKSVGTARVYQRGLRNVATKFAADEIALKDVTPEIFNIYLEIRAKEVSQRNLDIERMATQMLMWYISKKLPVGETLPVVRSRLQIDYASKAYTAEQFQEITKQHIKDRRSHDLLATEIAYAAGLRAHELLTLEPASERLMDIRQSPREEFVGIEGFRYSVVDRGGKIREVCIQSFLANLLEERRLENPQEFHNDGRYFTKKYNLAGGESWSNSFDRASKTALSWSYGVHGLRSSYAQERMGELQDRGHVHKDALKIVSREMGIDSRTLETNHL